MNDDAYLFTVRDSHSRSRYWLAGMDWAPQEKQKALLPSLHLKKSDTPHCLPGWVYMPSPVEAMDGISSIG